MKRISFLSIAAAFAIAGTAYSAPSKPDILFVLVDSVRPSHMGCYGYPRGTTPFLDRFAREEAVRFETVVAGGSWTQPAVMSLFTSVEPGVHLRVRPDAPHAVGLATLAGALRDAGYQTVGVTANAMTNRRFGFGSGFDVWDDYSATVSPDAGPARIGSGYAQGMALTRLGLGRLARRDPEKPLFLFLFYMDPHWDFHPPPPYDEKFSDSPVPPPAGIWMAPASKVDGAMRRRVVDAYDGEIAAFDHAVSNLVAAVSATPRWRDTLLVVAGDHGEAFWERGWASHGNNLCDDELLVPLLVRPPAGASPFRPGAVVRGQVGAVDVAPTVLDLAGVEIPRGWSGRSLKGLLGGGASDGRPVVSETRIARPGGWVRSARTDRWKVVAAQPFDSVLEAYDLVADPGETNNLARTWKSPPPEVAGLMPLLKPKR